jgi:flavin-binding protein dodecin
VRPAVFAAITGGVAMSIARVTEITASSKKSFEDAVRVGIKRAGKTLDNIKGAWIQEQSVKVDGDKVTEYRVNMKVSFVLKD